MSGRLYPISPSNTASTGPITYHHGQQIVVDGSTAAAVSTSWAKPTLLGGGGVVPNASLIQALFGTNAAYQNVAVASQTFAAMIANAAANVDPLISGTYTNNILIVAPDYQGESAATLESNYATYCTARRTAGWSGANKIVIVGMIPSATIAGATFAAVNSYLLANWTSWADQYFDPATNIFFGEANAAADRRLFLSDSTTLTVNGNFALADGITNAVGLALGI